MRKSVVGPAFVGLLCWFLVAAAANYHVGYGFLHGYWGISAYIRTINPSVGSNCLMEWDNICISEYPVYWIQLGYDKGDAWPTRLAYYREKNDASGWNKHLFSDGPAADSWHIYQIVNAQQSGNPGKYRFFIDGGDRGYYVVWPYEPKQLSSMAETTSSTVRISGTEHNYLSYYTGQSWTYWYEHSSKCDSPYWIVNLNDYWFTAGGGG